MWGNNEFGQLGLNSNEQIVHTPQMVDTQVISEQAAKYFEGDNSKS
jgi:alpha-tubulin suppressor-like RCC1 family protein